MSSSDNYYIQILTNIPIYLHRYVVPILYIIGNIGNLLNLAIFFQRSWRKKVCVFYFIICLFTSTILVNSTILGSIFTYGFNINVQNSNIVLCKLFYYFSYFCSTYFPIILILASIDRLLISSQNINTRLYSSKRLAYFTISVSAFIWSILSCHIFIKVNLQQFGVDDFVCYYDLSKVYLNFIAYSSLVITIILHVTLIILSIFSFKNVRRIRAITPHKRTHQIRTMNKKDFQLLRCLYIHNIVYIIFSIILAVGLIYGSTNALQMQTPTVEAMNIFLNNFGAFLHYIPYCTSFFIFVCISKAFRQELKRFGYKITGTDLAIIREEENHQQEPERENIELNNVVVSTIPLPYERINK